MLTLKDHLLEQKRQLLNFLTVVFLQQARKEIQEQAEKINQIAYDMEKTWEFFLKVWFTTFVLR